MDTSNTEVARKLREVAAAYTLKRGNLFQIRAYENAATSIEHLTSEIKDLWEEENLDQIPGIGDSLKEHLDELFKTGKVKHWEEVKKGIPEQTFEFLEISGIGPKTALKLAKLGVKDTKDLENMIKTGELLKKGISEKLVKKIRSGLNQRFYAQTGRMLLPFAFAQTGKVLEYLKKSSDIEKADALGSLRRMVSTIGDLDFSVASKNPQKAIEYIVSLPGIAKIIEKGEKKVSVALASGLQLDFIVTISDSYGALLQHFTGSKAHNIKLREVANKMGYSLSEHGIKKIKDSSKSHPELVSGSKMPKLVRHDKLLISAKTEEDLYKILGMDWIPPEIREDTGEIEAGLKHNLPKLVELGDIKGDLHIHSNLIIKSSHDVGANSVQEIVKEAKKLGYKYIGISDHQPSQSEHNKEQMIKVLQDRKNAIEHINYSQRDIRVLNLLEVDILPDGSLGVPDEALKLLDFALAGVHSAHHQPKEKMTERILKALANPCVRILTHPTNRLINQREASDVDWIEIFKFAGKNNKALEISSFPERLDLPDTLVRQAKDYEVKFVINTDAHQINQMELMKFGVSVARRGWAENEDIINSWDLKKLTSWFGID
ncbi:MAG: helix-hairpin-helix domain-containing protein [Candidatus Daviesbacteria bacterium]|nr:helix-hairpin-helix domain-containing protein [Candidatus Daviesbacteria bacterium]